MRYACAMKAHAHDFILQTNDGGAITSKDSRENVTVDMLHMHVYLSQLKTIENNHNSVQKLWSPLHMVGIINGFDIELSYGHYNILQQQMYVQLRLIIYCFALLQQQQIVFAFVCI